MLLAYVIVPVMGFVKVATPFEKVTTKVPSAELIESRTSVDTPVPMLKLLTGYKLILYLSNYLIFKNNNV